MHADAVVDEKAEARLYWSRAALLHLTSRLL